MVDVNCKPLGHEKNISVTPKRDGNTAKDFLDLLDHLIASNLILLGQIETKCLGLPITDSIGKVIIIPTTAFYDLKVTGLPIGIANVLIHNVPPQLHIATDLSRKSPGL